MAPLPKTSRLMMLSTGTILPSRAYSSAHCTLRLTRAGGVPAAIAVARRAWMTSQGKSTHSILTPGFSISYFLIMASK